jgi:hypothetical protein
MARLHVKPRMYLARVHVNSRVHAAPGDNARPRDPADPARPESAATSRPLLRLHPLPSSPALSDPPPHIRPAAAAAAASAAAVRPPATTSRSWSGSLSSAPRAVPSPRRPATARPDRGGGGGAAGRPAEYLPAGCSRSALGAAGPLCVALRLGAVTLHGRRPSDPAPAAAPPAAAPAMFRRMSAPPTARTLAAAAAAAAEAAGSGPRFAERAGGSWAGAAERGAVWQ